jgi:hypothetical protein
MSKFTYLSYPEKERPLSRMYLIEGESFYDGRLYETSETCQNINCR